MLLKSGITRPHGVATSLAAVPLSVRVTLVQVVSVPEPATMPADAVQLIVLVSFRPQVPFRSQRVLQVASHVGEPGGSHCSPAPASTHPSPHEDVTQLLLASQMRRGLVWQTAPCASGAPAWQVLPPVIVAHVSEPLQGLPSEQFAFDVHSNLQLLVQPLPD
jgi:hypothetical protein